MGLCSSETCVPVYVLWIYNPAYVSSSLSLTPQPEQYSLEMREKMRQKRLGAKEVCAVVLHCIKQ